MKDRHKIYIAGAILFVIVAALAFFAGMHAARYRSFQSFGVRSGMRAFMSGRFNRYGMRRMLSGQITAVSGNSVTIKLPSGLTQTITLSPSTQYLKTSTASQGDLKEGETISIFEQSQNGSQSAERVRISE